MEKILNTEGFLYCCFSETYLDEAMGSIKTLLEHNPNANISLVANKEVQSYYINNYKNIIFDKVILNSIENEPICFFRTRLYDFTPYEKTIALDSDTYILGKISNLFDLLDSFDLVMVPDEASAARATILGLKGGFSALGYYNCGFIMFRKVEKTKKLFKTWEKEFIELKDLEPADQGPLVRALVKTDLRFITLPKEYNTRLFSKCTSIHGKVKIIHGRAKNPDKIIKKISNINLVAYGSRVWIPNLQTVIHATGFRWFAIILYLLDLVNVDIGAAGGLGKIKKNKSDIIRRKIFSIFLFIPKLTLTILKYYKDKKILPFGEKYLNREIHDIFTAKTLEKENYKNFNSEKHSLENINANVLLDIIKLGKIKTFLGCGVGCYEFSESFKKHGVTSKLYNIQETELPHEFDYIYSKTTQKMIVNYDLVFCGGIPEPIKFTIGLRISKKLSSICKKYLVLSFIMPEVGSGINIKFPKQSISYDYAWIQWVSEEGFYFDPHLTLLTRKKSKNEDFNKSALVFKKQ